MKRSKEVKGGPSAPYWTVHEVNANTTATIIQEEPTLTLKQLAGMLETLEGSAHTILTKKPNFSCLCSK